MTVRQYDTVKKDQQNVTKLFFELLSVNFEELDICRQRDLVINIINSSIILRKYNQALDFISKLKDQMERSFFYVNLTAIFDYNMKSKDACRCLLLSLIEWLEHSDCK